MIINKLVVTFKKIIEKQIFIVQLKIVINFLPSRHFNIIAKHGLHITFYFQFRIFFNLLSWNFIVVIQTSTDTVWTSPVIAIHSISTFALSGSLATCTQERAGKSCVNTRK